MSTPDLLAALGRIETEARRAREGLRTGAIPKGHSALYRIENEAKDALWAVAQEHTDERGSAMAGVTDTTGGGR